MPDSRYSLSLAGRRQHNELRHIERNLAYFDHPMRDRLSKFGEKATTAQVCMGRWFVETNGLAKQFKRESPCDATREMGAGQCSQTITLLKFINQVLCPLMSQTDKPELLKR
ncbi:MAG: hypothetical protein SGJ27_14255 [Candidatus Melainabacteria bacterium]|nr:hypothetical protein [Candidatus Melainabacteria bacterium]